MLAGPGNTAAGAAGSTESLSGTVDETAEPFDPAGTETPAYLGRAIAALAADPRAIEKSGRQLTAGELAREYGFADVDGRQPPSFRMPDPN